MVGKRVVRAVAGCLLVFGFGCVRQTPPAPPRRLDFHAHLFPFHMKNGIRGVLVSDPHAKLVNVVVRYDVGAIDDPAGKEGLAHLVEHLMFDQRPTGVPLSRWLGQKAIFFNAETTLDYTQYETRAPKAALKDVLMVEAMRLSLGCHTIPEKAFERERQVVINELRQRYRGGQGAVLRALMQAAYPQGHPYRRLGGGDETTVSHLTLADACTFIHQHYVPGRMTLVVSGPVSLKELAAAAGGLQRIPVRAAAPEPKIPPVHFTHKVIHEKLPVDGTTVYVMWPLPRRFTAKRDIAEILLAYAAGRADYFASVYGEAVDAGSMELPGERAPVMVLALGVAKGADPDDAVNAAYKGAERLSRTLAKMDFDASKQSAMYNLMAQYDSPMARADMIADYIQFGPPDTRFFAGELKRINTLSYDRATSAASDLFDRSRAVVVVVQPNGQAKGASAHGKLAIRHDNARHFPVDPREADRPMKAPAPPATLAARRFTLDNGMKVILFPSGSAPIVDVKLIFDAGHAAVPAKEAGLAEFAAHMLTARVGATAMSGMTAALDFDRAGGEIGADVTDDDTTFEVQGLAMYVDILLRGLERHVKGGVYHERAIELARKQTDKLLNTPDAQAARARLRALDRLVYGPSHPYAKRGFADRRTLARIGVDDASDFKSRYYVARNATLIVSGSFDPKLVERDVRDLFADWPSGGGAVPAPPPAAPAAAPRAVAVAGTSHSQIDVTIAYPVPAGQMNRYPARLVVAAMLGEAAASVRDELGASYGISAQYLPNRGPGMYLVAGSIGAGNSGAALSLLRSRIAALRTRNDASARAFVRARRKVVSGLTAKPETAEGAADRIAFAAEHGFPARAYARLAERVAKLTFADVAPVIADELRPEKERILLAGDRALIDAACKKAGIAVVHQ